MPDHEGSSHYTSYLLRVWRGGETSGHRVVLENVATGERVGFASLTDLVDFLAAQTLDEETAPLPETRPPFEIGP